LIFISCACRKVDAEPTVRRVYGVDQCGADCILDSDPIAMVSLPAAMELCQSHEKPHVRFVGVLTRRAWGGPVLVLMFDPAPTYGRRRAPVAPGALGLWIVAGTRGVWTRAPLLSAFWVPVEGPLPPLGTPMSGGAGPVQTPFEGIKAVAGTG